MVCGYRDEARAQLSDKICTALQLANFWQDIVRRLRDRNRRYLPAEWQRFAITDGIAEGQIEGRVFTPEFRAMVQASRRTHAAPCSAKASPSRPPWTPTSRVTLDLFRKGGEAILDGIAAQDYDVLKRPPHGHEVQEDHSY